MLPAHCDVESTPRSTPCGAPRVACDAHGRLGARIVLDAGHSVRLPAAAGRPRSRSRGGRGRRAEVDSCRGTFAGAARARLGRVA